MDAKVAQAALDLAEGFEQGAAKDRIVKAFFAGVAECAPDQIKPGEILALSMSGTTVVEKWAGKASNTNGH